MIFKFIFTLAGLCYFCSLYAHDEFYFISTTDKYTIKLIGSLRSDGYHYEVKRSGLSHDKIRFISQFNYKSGYLCDEALILTNNNTCDTPCLFVWDFKKGSLKEDRLLVSTKEHAITNYQRSSVQCLEDGNCVVSHSVTWHNDCWYKSPLCIMLRLGDSVPNRCKIMWFYYLEDGTFSLKDCAYSTESSRELPHKSTEIQNTADKQIMVP